MQERYYNLDDTQKEMLGKAATTAAGLASTFAQRPKRDLSEVEKRCGKKPLGRKAREEWQKCASNQTTTTTTTTNSGQNNTMSKNTKIALIAGGSILVIGLIIFVIRKKVK